jgi:hypothetical protein
MIDIALEETRARTPLVDDYLGPAEVIEVRENDFRLVLPDGKFIEAPPAFAAPYAPSVGDILLVIGKGGRNYAIGVLAGTGRSTLVFQGDVDVRAVGGRLHLAGDEGVTVSGKSLDVDTGSIRMIARDVFQHFESAYQRVASLLRVHAGSSQTTVEGSSFLQAKRTAILSDETATINGREIHIG